MSIFDSFDDKAAQLKEKLSNFDNEIRKADSKLDKAYEIDWGNYLCPREQRLKGTPPAPSKFYVFRRGVKLPEHLVVVKTAPVKLAITHYQMSEARIQMKIDAKNHGYNALIDLYIQSGESGRYADHRSTLIAIPALVLSKNYRWNITPLVKKCTDSVDQFQENAQSNCIQI